MSLPSPRDTLRPRPRRPSRIAASVHRDASFDKSEIEPGDAGRREDVVAKIVQLKDVKPTKINFTIRLTETTHSQWETVLRDKTLYMTVPPVLSDGSKESFISLLEFAEERLGCSRCVLCVRKSRSDRAALLRAFMFMGFQLLGPGGLGPSGPAERPDYLYMVYVME